MAVSELDTLLRRCFHARLTARGLHSILSEYQRRASATSIDVGSAFLNSCMSYCTENDPLVPQYLGCLIGQGFVLLSDFITGLLLQWRGVCRVNKRNTMLKLVTMQTHLFSGLSLAVAQIEESDSRKSVLLLARWLGPLAMWASGNAIKEDGVNGNALPECVGALLFELANSSNLASKQVYGAVQHALDQCMDTFPNISMQLMGKLNTVPKPDTYHSVEPVSSSAMNMAAFQFEENIHHASPAPTRFATTAFLNELLRNGSTIDDAVVFSFLNTRYQSNHALMFGELGYAFIDAMTKTMDAASEIYQIQCQLFMYNKLPGILVLIHHQSAFDPFSSESLLLEMWQYLSASLNADSLAAGRRFLHICVVHKLLTSESVTMLIGEESSGAFRGAAAKDDLVSQISANHARGPRLIDELQKNDGGCGVISQAIVEIMNKYCEARDTQHLKDMANAMIRKPFSINAIALFVKPIIMLGPLCTLLEGWRWDDIHGESQPVYDEFGSILLLVVAFKERLNLSSADIGIQQQDSFLTRYMSLGHAEQDLSVLSEPDQNRLGDWIQALYIAEGLSDELTTRCSAQDFYLLVPTLLRQSVLAHAHGRLSNEMFRAGLEYLLEPFLLPSLLSAFSWIERIAEKETKIAVLIMQILVKPPSSLEAKEIHQTILAMAADRLARRGLESNTSLAPLIASMKTGGFSLESSLKRIAIESFGTDGILNRLERLVTSQVFATDDSYSAVLLNTAISVHGPAHVMQVFFNILIQFADGHVFHAMLDFVATISSMKSELRHEIQTMHTELATYLKKGETLMSHAIVHVHRCVGLYSNALAAQNLGMDHAFVPAAGMNVTSINLDTDLVATFEQNNQVQSEDIDQVLNEAVMTGMDQVTSNAFDDMFGLPTEDLGLENLDDLDLENMF